MLDPTLCRQRQQRLLRVLQDRRFDAAVVGHSQLVYYFTNHRPNWLQQAAFVLKSDGRSQLLCANAPDERAAVDACESYEAQRMATNRSDQAAAVAEKVVATLAGAVRRLGVNASAVSSQVLLRREMNAESIDADLSEMRRVKDADELALMKVAIRCTRAMYERAAEIIRPGVSEIEVFGELHAAAVRESGEPMTAHLGNDYRCGAGGGSPRGDEVAEGGQLYVLDVGPTYRGYFADNARTFSVDRKPTDVQMKAWQAIIGVFPIVEKLAKPGVRCRDLFDAASAHLEQSFGKPLVHHLGHGVGLEPHEAPHLNPKWDDVLQAGEVFTAEPGLYAPDINGGIRIENQYLVTEAGVENLTPFPMELVRK